MAFPSDRSWARSLICYLCKRSSSSTVDICADDTTLSASAAVSDLPAVQRRLREDINRIAGLLKKRMVLNKKRTIKLKMHVTSARLSTSLHRSYLG